MGDYVPGMLFSRNGSNEENNIYKLDGKYRRRQGRPTVKSTSANTQVEDRMQGSKPVMQNRPAAFGAQFSWTMAAQATALAAAFLFVSALVCGMI
jgi:hypothetical protein